MAMRPVIRWPATDRASFAIAASARPVTLSESAPPALTGTRPVALSCTALPAFTSASISAEPPARVPLAFASIAGNPAERAAGSATRAAAMRKRPRGSAAVPLRFRLAFERAGKAEARPKDFRRRQRQRAHADLQIEGRSGAARNGDAATLDGDDEVRDRRRAAAHADRRRLRQGDAAAAALRRERGELDARRIVLRQHPCGAVESEAERARGERDVARRRGAHGDEAHAFETLAESNDALRGDMAVERDAAVEVGAGNVCVEIAQGDVGNAKAPPARDERGALLAIRPRQRESRG